MKCQNWKGDILFFIILVILALILIGLLQYFLKDICLTVAMGIAIFTFVIVCGKCIFDLKEISNLVKKR